MLCDAIISCMNFSNVRLQVQLCKFDLNSSLQNPLWNMTCSRENCTLVCTYKKFLLIVFVFVDCYFDAPLQDVVLSDTACYTSPISDLAEAQAACCECDECSGVFSTKNGKFKTGKGEELSKGDEQLWYRHTGKQKNGKGWNIFRS